MFSVDGEILTECIDQKVVFNKLHLGEVYNLTFFNNVLDLDMGFGAISLLQPSLKLGVKQKFFPRENSV